MPEPILISSRRAAELLETAFVALKPEQRRLAEGITLALHSRHVGIPPELAAGLARVFTEPGLQPADYPRPWRAVAHRLQESLRALVQGESERDPQRTKTGIALRWNSAMSYVVLRLAAPLVTAGCDEVGDRFLFCADDEEEGTVNDDVYPSHVAMLTKAIEELSKQREGDSAAVASSNMDIVAYELFWQERAMMLAGMTRNQSGNVGASTTNTEHRILPAPHPATLALFMNLAPAFSRREQESPRLIQLATRRQLYDRRTRDAGASGVFVTRSPEDLHRMLTSELQYPRLVRLDRLFNSGYFAIERPPKPVQMRDIAIAGILPGTVSEDPVTSFVKTCWFEFLMRFSQLLQCSELTKSEVRWIEGDALWRMRPKALLTADAPKLPARFNQAKLQAYRNFFLMKLGWLPGYLDERAYYETLRLNERADRAQPPEEPEWVRAAWLAQRESARWPQQEREGRHATRQPERSRGDGFLHSPWALEKFAFVHVMLFLPAPLIEEGVEQGQLDKAKARAKWATYQALFGRRHPSLGVSITWLPGRVADTRRTDNVQAWRTEGWGVSHKHAAVAFSFARDAGVAQMAGNIIETWDSMLTEELRRA